MNTSIRIAIVGSASALALGTLGFAAASANDEPAKREQASSAVMQDVDVDDLDDANQPTSTDDPTQNTRNTAQTSATNQTANTAPTKNTAKTVNTAPSKNTAPSQNTAPSTNTSDTDAR